MKKSLLTGLLLSACTWATAQQFHATPGRTLHAVPRANDRTATDTIYPGSLDYVATMPTIYGAVGGGWVVGSNSYGERAFVQEFEPGNTVSVVGIGAWFGAKVQTSGVATSHITAKLYRMNGSGQSSTDTVGFFGAPNHNSVWASIDIPITDVDTSNSTLIDYTDFASEVYVGDHFGAGYDITGLSAGDSVGVVTTDDSNYEYPDHSWERFPGGWFSITRGWNLAIDLMLFVVLDQASASVGEASSFNGMQMSFVNGTATTDDAQLLYTVDHNAHMQLLVFDPSGRNIVEQDMGQQSAGQHNTTLNSASWGAGTYIVSLNADGRTLTKKFVKL